MERQRNGRDSDIAPTWRSVLMNDPCVYCGDKPDGLDHIRPVSLKGQNGWTNRAPACKNCDQGKGPVPLLMFLVIDGIARSKVARRNRYRDARCRSAAIRQIRERIGQAFYRGNIRMLPSGRMQYDHRTVKSIFAQ